MASGTLVNSAPPATQAQTSNPLFSAPTYIECNQCGGWTLLPDTGCTAWCDSCRLTANATRSDGGVGQAAVDASYDSSYKAVTDLLLGVSKGLNPNARPDIKRVGRHFGKMALRSLESSEWYRRRSLQMVLQLVTMVDVVRYATLDIEQQLRDMPRHTLVALVRSFLEEGLLSLDEIDPPPAGGWRERCGLS